MEVTINVYEPHSDFPNPGTPIRTWHALYENAQVFAEEFQDIRRAWDEYDVEATLPNKVLYGHNETYKQEVLRGLQNS